MVKEQKQVLDCTNGPGASCPWPWGRTLECVPIICYQTITRSWQTHNTANKTHHLCSEIHNFFCKTCNVSGTYTISMSNLLHSSFLKIIPIYINGSSIITILSFLKSTCLNNVRITYGSLGTLLFNIPIISIIL